MGKLKLTVLLGIVSMAISGVAFAGQPPVGACWVAGDVSSIFDDSSNGEGKFGLAGCTEGLTEDECTSASVLTEFLENGTCDDVSSLLQIMWDGSCDADIPPLGDLCVVLWTELGAVASQGLCENDLGGTWFDDLECGAPVPAMPPVAMGVMAMLILGGALLLLTLRSSLLSS